MVQAGQQAHLGRAMAGTPVGHVRLLVPSQERRARAQDCQLSGATDQLVVGFVGSMVTTGAAGGNGEQSTNMSQNGNLLSGQVERQDQVRLFA